MNPDYNNKCILPTAGALYLKISGIAGPPSGYNGGGEWPSTRKPLDCLSGNQSGPEFEAFNAGLQLGNNTLYVPGGNATISCGKTTVHFNEFQTKGVIIARASHTDIQRVQPSPQHTMFGMRSVLHAYETSNLHGSPLYSGVTQVTTRPQRFRAAYPATTQSSAGPESY